MEFLTPRSPPRSHATITFPNAEAVATSDTLERARRALAAQINSEPLDCAELEAKHGQVWDVAGLAMDFLVLGFAAPFVVVRRKSDNRLGSLLFQHHPRYYFAFQEDQ